MKKINFKIKNLNSIDQEKKYDKGINLKNMKKKIEKINRINNDNNNIDDEKKIINSNNYKNEVMELATKFVNNAGQMRRNLNQMKLKNGLMHSTQNLKVIQDYKNFETKNKEVNKYKLIQKINQQTYNSLKLENERLNNCISILRNNWEDLIGENTNLTEKNDKLFSRMRENKIIYEDIINHIKNTKENEILNKVYRFEFKNKKFEKKFADLTNTIIDINKEILNFKLKSKLINFDNYYKNLREFDNHNKIINFQDNSDNKNEEKVEDEKNKINAINDFKLKNIESKIDVIFDLLREKNIIDYKNNFKNYSKKLKLINNSLKY